GRHGSGTTVSRSGTAENFGKPLSKLLHGESVISSPPRNDMISVLTPVPVGARPLGRPAILPRTAPLMSGISIWLTWTPCSRSCPVPTLACAERGPWASSSGMSVTLLADRLAAPAHGPPVIRQTATRTALAHRSG